MIPERYAKQVRFHELGENGQVKLGHSRVVIIGVGATGSFVANVLARAGIGHLRLIDRDFVETSNLQRQILYEEAEAKSCIPKAIAARDRVAAINSEIQVEHFVADVNSKNIEEFIAGFDLVIDGSDNFLTRFLINDACVKLAIPWIYTGVVGGHGVSFAIENKGPCLRCYLPEMPASGQLETCDTAGILATTVCALGAFTATTAIKLMIGAELNQKIIHLNVWDPDLNHLAVKKNPACPTCVQRNFEYLEGKFDPEAVSLCGRNAVHIQSSNPAGFELAFVIERIKQIDPGLTSNLHTLKFTAEGFEFVVFKDGRAIIKGVTDSVKARALYSRYIES